MASIAVIMVSYHTGPWLQTAVQSLLHQPELSELVVVDNGNPPADSAWLQQQPAFITLSGHGNIGFARGCNLGASHTSADYLLFINPDIQAPSGFLAALLAAAKNLQGDWLLSPRIVDMHGHEASGSRRHLLTPWRFWGEVLRLPWLRLALHHKPLPEALSPVPATSGAAMLLPRATWQKLNGFDEGYFLHVEDLDLCWRLTRMGGQVWFLPRPALSHAGHTSDSPARIVQSYKLRGFMRYFWRHFRASPLSYITLLALWVRQKLLWLKP